eukprot:UN02200
MFTRVGLPRLALKSLTTAITPPPSQQQQLLFPIQSKLQMVNPPTVTQRRTVVLSYLTHSRKRAERMRDRRRTIQRLKKERQADKHAWFDNKDHYVSPDEQYLITTNHHFNPLGHNHKSLMAESRLPLNYLDDFPKM